MMLQGIEMYKIYFGINMEVDLINFQQDAPYSVYYISVGSFTGHTSQLFDNKWTPTVRYTWISSNSRKRADGSRSGYPGT